MFQGVDLSPLSLGALLISQLLLDILEFHGLLGEHVLFLAVALLLKSNKLTLQVLIFVSKFLAIFKSLVETSL